MDHEATWLLGHTRQISFGALWRQDTELLVEAVLHVRCRHLKTQPHGRATCAVHGFDGPAPAATKGSNSPRRLGGDRFHMVERGELVELELPPSRPKASLPVLDSSPNPCATASCTTADHTRGAACCRDLQIDIVCDPADGELEALVRSRLSPYLCKINREGIHLEAEMISACDFLEADGRNCSLHGRLRADGRTAKPDLCFDWPPKGKGLHPGCVFK